MIWKSKPLKIGLLLLINFVCFDSFCLSTTITPSTNTLIHLQENNLWNKNQPLRLHLGCGESHFNGYINIDFPLSEHTVQTKTGADVFADITTLNFPAESVDEIRSHHIFEHFDRPTAMALLCMWHQWLKIGGILIIETPDFDAAIRILTNQSYSYKQKQITLRHVFGSHEASWAIHCDGWYKEKFEYILSTLGFEVISVKSGGSQLIPNITVQAKKINLIDSPTIINRAKNLLRDSKANNSSIEEKIWFTWCKNFDAIFNYPLG